MDGVKKTSSNKALMGVLVFLCVVIVGLVVGIVIINSTRQTQEITESITDKTTAENANDDTLNAERIAEIEAYLAESESLAAAVNELLSQTPADAAGAQALYDQRVKQYLAQNDSYSAYSTLLTGVNTLMDSGYKAEALALITGSDLTVYNVLNREFFYKKALELAEALGQSEISADYAARLADIQGEVEILDYMTAEEGKRFEQERWNENN